MSKIGDADIINFLQGLVTDSSENAILCELSSTSIVLKYPES